jgi:hypothetical protein
MHTYNYVYEVPVLNFLGNLTRNMVSLRVQHLPCDFSLSSGKNMDKTANLILFPFLFLLLSSFVFLLLSSFVFFVLKLPYCWMEFHYFPPYNAPKCSLAWTLDKAYKLTSFFCFVSLSASYFSSLICSENLIN